MENKSRFPLSHRLFVSIPMFVLAIGFLVGISVNDAPKETISVMNALFAIGYGLCLAASLSFLFGVKHEPEDEVDGMNFLLFIFASIFSSVLTASVSNSVPATMILGTAMGLSLYGLIRELSVTLPNGTNDL